MTSLDGNSSGRLHVVGISGSVRRGSFNTALLRASQEVAPDVMEIDIFELNDIPLYNDDLEDAGDPKSVAALKSAIRRADGVLFVTPEHNHSTSAVLKNAIDWASRDKAKGSLIGKPVTLMGAGGMFGTARAQVQLQSVLAGMGALVMVKPGVLVTFPREKFDADGRLVDKTTRTILSDHLEKFAEWIARVGIRREATVA